MRRLSTLLLELAVLAWSIGAIAMLDPFGPSPTPTPIDAGQAPVTVITADHVIHPVDGYWTAHARTDSYLSQPPQP